MGAACAKYVLDDQPPHILHSFMHSMHMIATNKTQKKCHTLQHALVRCQGGSLLLGLFLGIPPVSKVKMPRNATQCHAMPRNAAH